MSESDINPDHYKGPEGFELINCTKQLDFVRGNAVKYIYRAGRKGGVDSELQDLQKARWYLDQAILDAESAKRLRDSANEPHLDVESGYSKCNILGPDSGGFGRNP